MTSEIRLQNVLLTEAGIEGLKKITGVYPAVTDVDVTQCEREFGNVFRLDPDV